MFYLSHRFRLILLSLLLSAHMAAFDGGLFHLNGFVIDANTGEPIPGVAVVCKRTGKGVVSDEAGAFSLDVSWSDSLNFLTISYENVMLKPPDSIFQKGSTYLVSLTPIRYELEGIEVKPENGIPLPLRSDVFKENPGAADYIFRPLSSLYYHANKRERRKRDLILIKERDELMFNYEHIYNRETIAQYSGLSGEELDACVIFCNANIVLQKGDPDEIVEWKILNMVSAFFKQKKAKDVDGAN